MVCVCVYAKTMLMTTWETPKYNKLKVNPLSVSLFVFLLTTGGSIQSEAICVQQPASGSSHWPLPLGRPLQNRPVQRLSSPFTFTVPLCLSVFFFLFFLLFPDLLMSSMYFAFLLPFHTLCLSSLLFFSLLLSSLLADYVVTALFMFSFLSSR